MAVYRLKIITHIYVYICYGLDGTGFNSRQKQKMFFFFKPRDHPWGPPTFLFNGSICLPFQWVRLPSYWMGPSTFLFKEHRRRRGVQLNTYRRLVASGDSTQHHLPPVLSLRVQPEHQDPETKLLNKPISPRRLREGGAAILQALNKNHHIAILASN